MEKFRVHFYPDDKTVIVAKDATILTAAISAGIYINSSCGGDGVCGRCKVIVKKGQVLTQSSGHISQEEKGQNIYLACVSEVLSDLEVQIPQQSRLNLEGLTQEEVSQRLKKDYTEPEDIEEINIHENPKFKHLAFTRKFYLELPAPTLEDKLSDLDRLERKLNDQSGLLVSHTSLTSIKNLSELLRSSDWKITVTVGKKNDTAEIMLIEPQDTSARNFGFVFDIGTTTVSGQLVNLISGKILGTKATYNKQAAFGSDVITRIVYAKNSDGLQELHQAVIDDMNQMIKSLVEEQGIDLNDVTCVACAGNTTMIHLLLRVDPTYIRREPYVPTLNFVPVLRASEVELHINPRGLLTCLPGVASYVGGDVTAGVIASGLYKQEELSVLIDIGTNGEIVIGNKEFLISCAASAGPAFEGSGVSAGMRASNGAIQKIRISPGSLESSYSVIGNTKPLGICGSGYIDLLSEMLKAGILDKGGEIKDSKCALIRQRDNVREFIVVPKEKSGTGEPIVINEADIENLKRAKAAIYSALSILIKHMGFSFNDIKKIFIAGGFGTYLDMEKAISIGLLPDMNKKKFEFIGNSSLAGAREALLSEEAREKADEVARKMAYLELSTEPGYMDEYMAALFFPHTDLSLFPNIGK
ncbi:MAG: ASKHA domain-containing protein [Candidatus Omnitrophica bacterium]|nr:ASKHA domain-containing protein [Candidatus Omnitrophota bacterium]